MNANSTVNNPSEPIEDLPPPPRFPGINRLLLGAPVQPLKRLEGFSDRQFEIFTWEWLAGYKSKNYVQIQRVGAANDKGRDVIAWIDPQGTKNRRWDNYQCKHYGSKLTPSVICLELGKLCYYTYRKDYTIPEQYYFVSYKGIGDTLEKLFGDPQSLLDELVDNWDVRCKAKITKTTEIELDGDFLEYCREFPFDRIKSVPPETLLVEHSQTQFHAVVFGNIPKERPELIVPEYKDSEAARLYIIQLFEAFSAFLKSQVKSRDEIASHPYLGVVFDDSRVCYYSAESLQNFSRETLPSEDYYFDLMKQFFQGIVLVANNPAVSGIDRLQKVCEIAVGLQISHVLRPFMSPSDAKGICHQLVDSERIRWI